jgi:hypothetical protein
MLRKPLMKAGTLAIAAAALMLGGLAPAQTGEAGSGASGSGAAANTGSSADTMKDSRRSRPKVPPTIISDTTYPDPAPWADPEASKARRDAKRAARAARSGTNSGSMGTSPGYSTPGQ